MAFPRKLRALYLCGWPVVGVCPLLPKAAGLAAERQAPSVARPGLIVPYRVFE